MARRSRVLPAALTIEGVTWTVVEEDLPKGTFGKLDTGGSRIVIDKGQSCLAKSCTLVHEVCHAFLVNANLGLVDEEELVKLLEPLVIRLLQSCGTELVETLARGAGQRRHASTRVRKR
mgnify:CR=1 FL=1